MLFCSYEDRPRDLVGLKLMMLSLARYWPSAHVQITCPAATDDFAAWVKAQPNATLMRTNALACRGFDVKATLLGEALDAGHKQVGWLDSDVILAGDPRPIFDSLDDNTLLVSEEMIWGAPADGYRRTDAWGLERGQVRPMTINSGVMRWTAKHRTLLHRWAEAMTHPDYRAAQDRPWDERPVHLMSDQEVLTALMGSIEFADVPLRYLRRGKDIAMTSGSAGYSIIERLGRIGQGLPVFIHALGPKPWAGWFEPMATNTSRAMVLERLHAQLSPYAAAAAAFCDQLDEPTPWTRVHTPLARLISGLTLNEPNLRALPLCLIDAIGRSVKWRLGKYPWQHVPDMPVNREYQRETPAPNSVQHAA